MTAATRIRRRRAVDGRLGGTASALLLAPFLVLMLVAFVYPLVDLLLISVLEPAPTLENYRRVFAEPVYGRVFLRTVWISLLTAVCALILAFPVAYLMSRSRGLFAGMLAACVLLPFWSSVLVRTAAWSVMLGREGMVNTTLKGLGLIEAPLQLLYTQGAVIIGMTHVLMPFMVLPLYGTLRAIPDDYARAAALLGASRFRVFAEVIVPIAMPGIISGFLIVFLTALGFFITPTLLGSPQEQMIVTLISQQVREVLDWPFAAAVVSLLTALVLAIAFLFNRFLAFDKVLGGGR